MANEGSPTVLTMEHQGMQEEMARATRAGGRTEEAAWQVTRVLYPHVFREEEFAIPPLLLLPKLARGEVTPDMEMPRMLQEHKAIIGALQKLLQAATSEQHTGFARFAQKLILHAQMEEELLYPAAILVGEYLKLKLGRA